MILNKLKLKMMLSKGYFRISSGIKPENKCNEESV